MSAVAATVIKAAAKSWFLPDTDWRRAEGFGGHVIDRLKVAGYAVVPAESAECDRCVDCGTELTRVFPDAHNKQYNNALELVLGGGYAMFFDNIDGDHHIFLCHDCAHKACLVLPWLNKLIQPEKSHAHTAEFWEFNNGHLGWDKPATAEVNGD